MTTTLQRIQFKPAVKVVFTGRGADGLPGPPGPRELFESVAVMKAAASLLVGIYARTAGYFVAGDGGGSDYQIVAGGTGTADDAFFINLNNGNQAKLLLPDPEHMTVRQLGVVGGPIGTDYASLPNDSARIAVGEASSVDNFDLLGLGVKTTFHTNVEAGLIVKRYYNGKLHGLSLTQDSPVFIKEETSLRDTALIRDRTKSPVLDFVRANIKRKFLWLGTSIPNQGGDNDSYPLLTCNALGVDLNNMAWPGTGATFNPADDPMLIGTTKSLSMTEDDRVWGAALPTVHPNAYEDAFDPQNPATEMTADFRIKAPFQAAWNGGAGEPISLVVLDHNHNDRGAPVGTLTPESHSIAGITKGATTVIGLGAIGTVVVGDAVAIEVTGIANLNHFAGRVQAVAGVDVTLNIDSSGFAGTFSSGTLYKYDRDTISGAWEFLFRYIMNCSIRFGLGDAKIVTCNSFSEYSHGIDDRLFFYNSRNIKAVTDKYRTLFGRRFAFFDVAYEMAMTLVDQETYAGDFVHPTTTERRQAIANYWSAWFMGGRAVVRPANFWLPAGSDKTFIDQAPAHYSRFLNGFGTVKRFIGASTVVYSNNFPAGALGSGWSNVGTPPVVVAAPWGGGEFALHSTAPANGASGVSRSITIGIGRKVEMDFWLPQVTGFASLPINQLVTLWAFTVAASGGYINFRLQIRPTSTGLLARYFKTPNTSLTSMSPAPANDLLANTKYRLRCEMYGGLSGDNLGAFLIYLNDILVGGPYVVEDQGQTPITTLTIGATASTLGDPFETYIGNLVLSEIDVRDVSSRLTGTFLTQTGDTVTSVNGENISVGAPSIGTHRYFVKAISAAAGNGATDDLAALIVARNKGVPLDGGGLTYAVSTQFEGIEGMDIANAKFKRLNHAASNEERTIYIPATANRTRLNDIIVDRNGDGTVGQISGGGAAGIYTVGGRDHHWGRVEVYGADRGTGIYLSFVQDSDFDDLFVHDMFDESTSTTDEQLQGVLVASARNSRFRVRVRNLFSKATDLSPAAISTGAYYGSIATGTAIVSATATTVVMASDASAVDSFYYGMQMVVIAGTGAGYANTITGYTGTTKTASFGIAWPVTLDSTSKVTIRTVRYSRGFAGGGCRDCQLSFISQFTDEACDITGGTSDGHPGLQILDGKVSDIGCWGWKFANIQRNAYLGDLEAIRVGNAGFVFAGATTQDIDGSGLIAREIGYGSIWPLTTTAGFRVSVSADPLFPKGIRLRNATAISTIGNMAFGAYITTTPDPLLPNELIGFRSIGHVKAETYGAFTGELIPYNLVTNGEFAINQELVASAVDATDIHDRHRVIVQTAAIAPSTLSFPEATQGTALRLTQSQAAAQRFGFITGVMSDDTLSCRNGAVTMTARVRCSVATNIRYAICEWTGTANAVNGDPVNDWNSGTFTAGNFFKSTTLNILAVGVLDLTGNANVWQSLPALTGVVGNTANNLVLVIWTENTQAQNVTLDVGLLQLQRGLIAREFPRRTPAEEFERCRRHYQKSFALATAPATQVNWATGAHVTLSRFPGANTNTWPLLVFATPFWKQPAMTYYNPVNNNAQAHNLSTAADCVSTTAAAGRESNIVFQAGGVAGWVVDQTWVVHWAAKASMWT
jgi:hypothetical protein